MVEAATEFRKNGFNDDDSAILATVASKFSNVADEAISAGESASFIISQMIAFNIEAENAESIIDKVNEVANSFSVSSGNLATALGIVASTSAAMGNSLDETLGIVTAITEQTRNASKSARAANTIFARLAQVVDENSDTGKQLTDIYNGLGIALYDSNGQMRSTYDILHDLSKEWGSLDKNTQQYIAITSAGTNQLNNFLALMNNFDHAVKATETSMNSAGSAARENARYMEGLDARASQLKATFQDLANNVIDDELVGSLLDLANNVLGALNTGLGQTLTQIGLLAGVGWGAKSLLDARKIFTVAISQFREMAAAISLLGNAKSIGDIFTVIGMSGGAALPIILAISAAVVGIYKIVKAINKSIEENKLENLEKKFTDLDDNLSDVNGKLDDAKTKLEELNGVPMSNRGEEWQAEHDRLELLIADYEDLIRLMEQEQAKAAEKIRNQRRETGVYGAAYTSYDSTGQMVTDTSRFTAAQQNALTQQYKKEEDAVYALAAAFNLSSDSALSAEERIEDYKKQLAALGITLYAQTQTADEYNVAQAEIGKSYTLLLTNTKDITEKKQKEITAWLSNNKVLVEAIKSTGAQNEGERKLVEAYDALTKAVGNYTGKQEDANEVTDDATSSVYSQIKAQEMLNAKLDSVQSALDEYASSGKMTTSVLDTLEGIIPGITKMLYDESGALTSVGEEALTSAARLIQLAIATKTATASANDLYTVVKGKPNQMVSLGGAGGTLSSDVDELWKLYESIVTGKWTAPKKDGTTGGTSTSTTPAWVKQAEAAFAKLEHMRNMDLINEEEYYAELNRLNEKYYAGKSDYLDKYWSYQEKYYQWQREQEKAALRAVLQAQVDKLNDQKDTLDKIASAAQKQIDDRLSELNDQLDEINAKYDAELEALEAKNDALDDQINKEKLLQNLAKAQATMKYVFKDGRFQYVQDADAVSDAKADLAEFEREQALKKAKEEIEERRQLALKDIQDEINHWQQLSDIWNNYTTDYENSINMQLYLQKYGMEMEGLTFEQRLAQARQFVNEYNATMASLSNAQASLDRFDSSYKAGQSTEDQLKALKDEYWAARERNDAAGMESANRRANIIRGLGDVVTANVAIEAAKKRAISGEAGLKRPYASGTMSATPGLHLVGEQGPELRVLNKGDGILSADMTRNLYKMATAPQLFMQQAAGGGNTNISVANITLPNVRNAQDFLDGLRNMAYQRAYARA